MEIVVEEIGEALAKITLAGRMDVIGTDKIDLRFNVVAASNRGLITDMAAVTFLSSIGIRTLVTCAMMMQRRGGKLVLLAPQPDVYKVLEITGVLDLLPVVDDAAAAMTAIGA